MSERSKGKSGGIYFKVTDEASKMAAVFCLLGSIRESFIALLWLSLYWG